MQNYWRILIILCLTLGLAPFLPEPHLWGKLKWVAGGGHGMTVTDWFDLFLHGAPFLLLIAYTMFKINQRTPKK
ncbi:MAG: hypothetical protein CMC08_05045 [Flavobacteriaceae bacterium]|nr:hypothetical protein [Flavobacteriaceae bacterium]